MNGKVVRKGFRVHVFSTASGNLPSPGKMIAGRREPLLSETLP